MPEDLGERTEEPTSKRLQEARERGQIGKSTDLSAAIVMAGAAAVVLVLGPYAFRSVLLIMRHHLSPATLADATADRIAPDVVLAAVETAKFLLPAMLVMMVVSYAAQVLQVGVMFTTKPLEPNLNRLNIVKGLGKLFSKRSLVKTGMDVLKLAALTLVVVLVIRLELPAIAGLTALTAVQGFLVACELVRDLALWAILLLIAIGLIDWTYQKWQNQQDLRMTKHEVKDERKSSEGNPEVKSQRMRLARQIALQRLSSDVPRADVIVTNPTHYAVALRYDTDKMSAPKVVAKGADYLAMRIRQIANIHGVPIVERPPLARALYAKVPVGAEIHPEHYEAVAEVLAYVYRLEGKLAS